MRFLLVVRGRMVRTAGALGVSVMYLLCLVMWNKMFIMSNLPMILLWNYTFQEVIHGTDGKSAYEYAQESGYEGTEAEFTEDINPDNMNSFIVTELAKRGQLEPEFAQTVEECTTPRNCMFCPMA